MVNLLVDEAYAFDYLSILDIKRKKKSENYDAWINCYKYLKYQFDDDKWLSIIYSEEYKNMIKANELTFDAVDKAKNNEVTAQYVDQCNYQRYLAKNNFQKIFFNSALSETKIGYNNIHE